MQSICSSFQEVIVTSFQGRLEQADLLEKPFIESFNEACSTHKIVKFGVETTQISNIHQYIRSARDSTSQFVRYLPDAVLVRTQNTASIGPKTALIEFKVQTMLVQHDSFFNRIKATYGNKFPALTNKQDVFATEKDALDVYRKITSLGVRVVVVVLQRERSTVGDGLRAQYAQDIVVCHEHVPSAMGSGSGTSISNTHFDSYLSLPNFFEGNFGISRHVSTQVIAALEAKRSNSP